MRVVRTHHARMQYPSQAQPCNETGLACYFFILIYPVAGRADRIAHEMTSVYSFCHGRYLGQVDQFPVADYVAWSLVIA